MKKFNFTIFLKNYAHWYKVMPYLTILPTQGRLLKVVSFILLFIIFCLFYIYFYYNMNIIEDIYYVLLLFIRKLQEIKYDFIKKLYFYYNSSIILGITYLKVKSVIKSSLIINLLKIWIRKKIQSYLYKMLDNCLFYIKTKVTLLFNWLFYQWYSTFPKTKVYSNLLNYFHLIYKSLIRLLPTLNGIARCIKDRTMKIIMYITRKDLFIFRWNLRWTSGLTSRIYPTLYHINWNRWRLVFLIIFTLVIINYFSSGFISNWLIYFMLIVQYGVEWHYNHPYLSLFILIILKYFKNKNKKYWCFIAVLPISLIEEDSLSEYPVNGEEDLNPITTPLDVKKSFSNFSLLTGEEKEIYVKSKIKSFYNKTGFGEDIITNPFMVLYFVNAIINNTSGLSLEANKFLEDNLNILLKDHRNNQLSTHSFTRVKPYLLFNSNKSSFPSLVEYKPDNAYIFELEEDAKSMNEAKKIIE